jgi:hypothetical protein
MALAVIPGMTVLVACIVPWSDCGCPQPASNRQSKHSEVREADRFTCGLPQLMRALIFMARPKGLPALGHRYLTPILLNGPPVEILTSQPVLTGSRSRLRREPLVVRPAGRR